MLGVVVVSIAITLAIGSIALLIATVTRTSTQAQSLEIGVAVALGVIGARLIPVQQLPHFATVMANATPNGIAIVAFNALTSGDVGALTIMRSVGLLLAFAVVVGPISLGLARKAMRS